MDEPRTPPGPRPDPWRPERRADASGFALPATVFVLALLTLLSATGFFASWLEIRSSQGFSTSTRAFYVADGGLATTLAGAPGPGPAAVAFGGGIARVRSTPLLDLGPGETLHLVESHGSVVARGDTTTRRVSLVAWRGGPPRTTAALLIADTLGTSGATGVISGLDAGGCSGTPVGGVASWRATVPGGGLLVLGSPPLVSLAPGVSVTALTGLRWADLVGPGGIRPDAAVPPDPWPPAGAVALVRVDTPGPLGAAHAGTGALVATGDLNLGPGFRWTGLVLVGGSLTLTGDVTIRGGVATGLDTTLAGAGDLGSGRIDLAYDSCAVAAAAARLAPRPVGIPGSWREHW